MTPTPEAIEQVIEKRFLAALTEAPDPLSHDLRLMDSGLNSLEFARLVVQLEQELGYDPFTLLEEPSYPRTYGEFVALYIRFADHRK